jgi:hypothetical protein
MDTKTLRAAAKAVDPEARVSGRSPSHWTVRTEYKLDEIRAVLASLGLCEYRKPDIEGSRYDWTYVLFVQPKEEG